MLVREKDIMKDCISIQAIGNVLIILANRTSITS